MNTLQQENGEIKKEVTKDGEMGFFSKATAMFIINKYPQYSLQSFLNEISTYKNLRKEFFDCMDRQLATAQAEGAAEERNLFKEFVKRQFGFKHYKYDKNSIETIIREYDSYLQALTTKEHHAS